MADQRTGMAGLLELMARLRSPEGGCSWDRAQDFDSIAPYTIEEAYEVADAIRRGDLDDLKDELGDLLFQVVFHARMAEEQGAFDFDAVAAGVADKMRARHTHVFGSAPPSEALPGAWERRKAEARVGDGLLADIEPGLPDWLKALKYQRRAASVGFDWDGPEPVLDKINEEAGELRAALREGRDTASVAAELGDLLFSVINLGRHLALDPGRALRAANAKFKARFELMEQAAAEAGRALGDLGADELERLWNRAKRQVP